MNINKHIKFSLLSSWITLLIGTIILIAYVVSHSGLLITLGLRYILIAMTINTAIVIRLLINSINSSGNKLKFIFYTLLPIINLPVAIIYCAIALAIY
jgi:hypothetical protein